MKPALFFDLKDFPFADIFDGVENVWEVIPRIAAYSKGSLLKGSNCQIASSAVCRGGVILGNDVVIGHHVELKNCLVLNGAAIAHLNYVGDSLIGNRVNIAGGCILANFRFDEKEIIVSHDGKVYQTGLKKFGAVVGDHSKTGVNSVLNPGVILEKNCFVYPLVAVTGYHPAGSLIKK